MKEIIKVLEQILLQNEITVSNDHSTVSAEIDGHIYSVVVRAEIIQEIVGAKVMINVDGEKVFGYSAGTLTRKEENTIIKMFLEAKNNSFNLRFANEKKHRDEAKLHFHKLTRS